MALGLFCCPGPDGRRCSCNGDLFQEKDVVMRTASDTAHYSRSCSSLMLPTNSSSISSRVTRPATLPSLSRTTA